MTIAFAALIFLTSQAFALTPSAREACCFQVIGNEKPDPKLCSDPPPSLDECRVVVKNFQLAAIQHMQKANAPSQAASTKESTSSDLLKKLGFFFIALGVLVALGGVAVSFFKKRNETPTE